MTAVLAVLLGSRHFGDRLSHRLANAEDEQVLLSVFGITLVVAGLTTLLDASAAVGAFLVGLALTGQAAERSRALLSPLRDVFAAVFFVSFGLSIDPSTLPPVLLAAAALAAGHAGHQGADRVVRRCTRRGRSSRADACRAGARLRAVSSRW